MTFASIIAPCLFLLLFAAAWFLLSYFFTSSFEDPSCSAKVTGTCGDTMELQLKIKKGRITETYHWTDGCTTSRNCIESAARLAHGKTPDYLKKITMWDIIDDIGSLPESHVHCAQLAEITLHQSLQDYLQHQIPEKISQS